MSKVDGWLSFFQNFVNCLEKVLFNLLDIKTIFQRVKLLDMKEELQVSLKDSFSSESSEAPSECLGIGT